MIESVSTNLSNSAMFRYAQHLPIFMDKERITFKPGLNILFGKNGNGKSTLLQIIGQTTACMQRGFSVVTSNHVYSTTKFEGGKIFDLINLDVVHDGQSVMYFDGHKRIELDNDFYKESFLETIENHSQQSPGEKILKRFDEVYKIIKGKEPIPSEILYKSGSQYFTKEKLMERHDSVDARKFRVIEKRLNPQIEVGQPTICLDEPEVNLCFLSQHALWNTLKSKKVTNKYQLIVVTHSLAALGIKDAHYIDFDDGTYRQECEKLLTKKGKELSVQ